MNLTSQKFFADERKRLAERRATVQRQVNEHHERLTSLIRELALLEDLDQRLWAHLPETDYEIVDGPLVKLEASA